MNNELKPCPFCGAAMETKGFGDFATGPGEVYVICDCGAMGAGGKNQQEAIAAWNRRAPVSDQVVGERVEGIDLSDLLTYPSPHGTLIRLADVQCRIADARRAASAPVEGDDELPLPVAGYGGCVVDLSGNSTQYYTEKQLLGYARDYLAHMLRKMGGESIDTLAERALFIAHQRRVDNVPDYITDDTIMAGEITQREWIGWMARAKLAQARAAGGSDKWDAVPQTWLDLYVSLNHMMARLGANGDIDARSTEAGNVMNALHAIDGGTVSTRALELHEKAHMPLFQATALALRECGMPGAAGGARDVGAQCDWTLDDPENGIWQSSCGESWSFVSGGPAENFVRFCQGCGKAVKIATSSSDTAGKDGAA